MRRLERHGVSQYKQLCFSAISLPILAVNPFCFLHSAGTWDLYFSAQSKNCCLSYQVAVHGTCTVLHISVFVMGSQEQPKQPEQAQPAAEEAKPEDMDAEPSPGPTPPTEDPATDAMEQ